MVTACKVVFAGSVVLLMAGIAARSPAQVSGQSAVDGVVRDFLGDGIVGAEVTASTGERVFSGDGGAFRIARLPSGLVVLSVRRLGFRPATLEVTLAAGRSTSVTITVAPIAQALEPVLVRSRLQEYRGPFADFHRRREQGIGHYITRAQIERRNPQLLTDMLRQVPGLHLQPTRLIPHAVRMRGSRCPPIVWIDGSPADAAEFDLDYINPRSVEGVEVYNGLATVPAQFMGTRGRGSCGAVVIWTRIGERRQKKAKKDRMDIPALVQAAQVYTADQVDVAAQPDTAAPILPLYPDALRVSSTNGTVVAEFVVDSTGVIETETFGVVSSSHELFADAVRVALAEGRYVPAQREGRLVRQVVQQRFNFMAALGRP